MKHSQYKLKQETKNVVDTSDTPKKIRRLFVKRDVLPYSFGIRNFTFLLKLLIFTLLALQLAFFFDIQYSEIIRVLLGSPTT